MRLLFFLVFFFTFHKKINHRKMYANVVGVVGVHGTYVGAKCVLGVLVYSQLGIKIRARVQQIKSQTVHAMYWGT